MTLTHEYYFFFKNQSDNFCDARQILKTIKKGGQFLLRLTSSLNKFYCRNRLTIRTAAKGGVGLEKCKEPCPFYLAEKMQHKYTINMKAFIEIFSRIDQSQKTINVTN